MRNYFLIGLTFIFFTACGNSDKLFPKKYLGSYHGIQEAYEVSVGEEPVEIPASKYDLVLTYEKYWLSSSKQTLEGTYEVKAETKMNYTFDVDLENGVVEEWQLWKTGKRLIRNPTSRQSEVM